MGLVTGACLAHAGHEVVLVDVDAARVEALRRGEVPFYEADLERLLREAGARIRFTTDPAAVAGREVVFLAVATPSRADGSCDTSAVFTAVRDVATHLAPGAVLVVKSTVPPGTTDQVDALLATASPHRALAAANPEFLREGRAVADFQNPDRVVVGRRHPGVDPVLQRVYDGFVDVDRPLLFTDPISAEVSKYAANTYLAMRVAFINEVAALTELAGADIDAVRRAIGADTRIGAHYLSPGPGYGGTCFPKDVQALAHYGRSVGRPLRLAEATHAANRDHRDAVIARIRERLAAAGPQPRLALWGLAFKANSDDVRDAIALEVLDGVAGDGVEVAVYDPRAGARALGARAARVTRFAVDPLDAAAGADVVALLTEWPEFAAVPLHEVARRMRGDTLVDARNLLRPSLARAAGLRYLAVGHRPSG